MGPPPTVIPRPRRGRGDPFLFGRRDGLPRRACGPPRNDGQRTVFVGADGDIGPYEWCRPCRARPTGRADRFARAEVAAQAGLSWPFGPIHLLARHEKRTV